MTALYLFVSTFCLVLSLGLQSQFVNNGFWKAAMANSFAIGLGNLVLFKLAPDASGIEVIAYLSGGPIGIVASMVIFKFWRKNHA